MTPPDQREPPRPLNAFDPITAAEGRHQGHWLSEDDQLRFFDETMALALKAEHQSGTVIRHVEVAGILFRLVFAGDRLLPLFMPALAHLAVEPKRPPQATFHIWDSSSTGVEMIPPPCRRECLTDRGDIWGMSSERIKSAFHWIECSVNLADLARQEAIYWVRSDDTLPYWSKASPLRTLFHWLIQHHGGQLLHAAAVGTTDGALLITGKGGVGKSSTALSCLSAGMTYIADDYLVVRLDPQPRVYSLYSTAKLDPDQVDRFPSLRPFVTNEQLLGEEKAVIQLYPTFADQILISLPLRAIVVPTWATGTETAFVAVSTAVLQRAAAFTTMSQLPHAGRGTHQFINRMVAELPRFKMVLGSDLDRIPGAVEELLRKSDTSIGATAGVARPDDTRPVERPLVTVVVPVFNGASFLAEAVESILAQDYPALELIIVDDGSTDDLEAAVARLPLDIRFFRQENAGAGAARNRGIRDASGDLLAFLDVDDLWPAGNLDVLVDHLIHDPGADVVHGLAQVTRRPPEGGVGEYLGSPQEGFQAYIGAGLYRRTAFEKVGLFDQELRFGEDADWFNRAKELDLPIINVENTTLFVRRHEGNMTGGKSLIELNTLRVVKKALDRRRERTRSPGQSPHETA